MWKVARVIQSEKFYSVTYFGLNTFIKYSTERVNECCLFCKWNFFLYTFGKSYFIKDKNFAELLLKQATLGENWGLQCWHLSNNTRVNQSAMLNPVTYFCYAPFIKYSTGYWPGRGNKYCCFFKWKFLNHTLNKK